MNVPRFRLRCADVAATLALDAAFSGTAYAVTALPADSVGTQQLKADAVTGPKIRSGAVHTSDLADLSVTAPKLAAGAVSGVTVQNDSLTLTDVKGANVTGAISFALGAGSCGSLQMGVSGAAAGQVALISTTAADWPTSVSAGTPCVLTNQVRLPVCNNSGSSVTVTDLSVRVVTIG